MPETWNYYLQYGAALIRRCAGLQRRGETDKEQKNLDPTAALPSQQKKTAGFDFVRRAPFCDAFLRKSNQLLLARARAYVGLVRA